MASFRAFALLLGLNKIDYIRLSKILFLKSIYEKIELLVKLEIDVILNNLKLSKYLI